MAEVTQIDKRPGTRGAPTGPNQSTRTASDATGISLEDRGPINPAMPQMPPA